VSDSKRRALEKKKKKQLTLRSTPRSLHSLLFITKDASTRSASAPRSTEARLVGGLGGAAAEGGRGEGDGIRRLCPVCLRKGAKGE
jgi:hypothetical protein